jgi:hypothetical protein
MCKRKHYLSEQAIMAAEGAYEGQTVRLASRDHASHEQRERHSCTGHGGFPWWTLWLIWPLIGVAKWFVPLYLGAISAGLAPIAAVALIVIGLVLIGRQREA